MQLYLISFPLQRQESRARGSSVSSLAVESHSSDYSMISSIHYHVSNAVSQALARTSDSEPVFDKNIHKGFRSTVQNFNSESWGCLRLNTTTLLEFSKVYFSKCILTTLSPKQYELVFKVLLT